jgi:hypothetical protein
VLNLSKKKTFISHLRQVQVVKSNMSKLYLYLTIICAILFLAIGVVWFFFFRPSLNSQTPTTGGSFNVADNTTSVSAGNTTPATGANNTQQPVSQTQTAATQKVFSITAGPVVGATLIQTLHPTTTLARYIDQETGHVFDLPLDVPGAVPRVVSNTTIPGGYRAVWVQNGGGALMQYLEGSTIKTVYLGFPVASTTAASVTPRIQFLPDNVQDLAASPDGKSIVYTLHASGGTTGYIAKYDGSGAKVSFTLPLSQVLVSWPSPNTLLAQTNSAAGAAGMAFSISVTNGGIIPLVYSPGLTATANKTFSNIVYQTNAGDGVGPSSYSHEVKTGLDKVLNFEPTPEKCIWSKLATSTMYCAIATAADGTSDYLDAWHQGTASYTDTLFNFNLTASALKIVGTPGPDGGQPADIFEMALSPDDHYLDFVAKGSRSLWGVRLTQ